MSHHVPVLGHFTFWAVSSGRKSLEDIQNCEILLINCTFKQYFVLLIVSFLKWLNWKEAAPNWRSFALSKCNTLESAHVNHTERTTENKRSYRKTVKSKRTQIQNYTTAHHQICPACTMPTPASLSCPEHLNARSCDILQVSQSLYSYNDRKNS